MQVSVLGQVCRARPIRSSIINAWLVGFVGSYGLAACEPAVTTTFAFPMKDGAAEITGDITGDLRLSANQLYRLKKIVVVRPPATLTIEAGTTIQGDVGTALVVARGARIEAFGTKQAPIVMTSAKPAGMRKAGNWGGLFVLGRAPTNLSTGMGRVEELPEIGELGAFGGSNPQDSNGTLRYVRVEFAGEPVATRRSACVTFAGVGSGTIIENLQCHRAAEDGFRFVGGTANARRLLASQVGDDGFEMRAGYQGKAQYLVAQLSESSGDAGLEVENHPVFFDALPRTSPTVFNVTLVSASAVPARQVGVVLRRGAAGNYFDFVVTGFNGAAVDVRDTATSVQFSTSPVGLDLRHAVFFRNAAMDVNFPAETMTADNDGGFDEMKHFTRDDAATRTSDPELRDPMKFDGPRFDAKPGSPALSDAKSPDADGFLEPVSFVGGVGGNDWTAGWTAYPAP